MNDETNELLKAIVQELRSLRREIAAIQGEIAPFAEERRQANRMQSPLIGVDLFHADAQPSGTRD